MDLIDKHGYSAKVMFSSGRHAEHVRQALLAGVHVCTVPFSRNGICDYITGTEADRYAIREVAELLLGLMGSFDAVVQSRTAFDAQYAEYFSARQAVVTHLPNRQDGVS